MALGTITWNCWALLKVVQRLVSTHSEMMIPVGLEAKHHHCPQPSSPPARRKAGTGSRGSQGPRHTNLPIGLWGSAEWPLTDDHLLRGQCSDPGSAGLAREDCRSPFVSLGLCQSPSIPEMDGTNCEVRVEFIELSLGCFFIVIAKLPRLAFACQAL